MEARVSTTDGYGSRCAPQQLVELGHPGPEPERPDLPVHRGPEAGSAGSDHRDRCGWTGHQPADQVHQLELLAARDRRSAPDSHPFHGQALQVRSERRPAVLLTARHPELHLAVPAVHRPVPTEADAAAVLLVELGEDLHLLADRLAERLGHPLLLLGDVGVTAPDRRQQLGDDPALERPGCILVRSHEQGVEPGLADHDVFGCMGCPRQRGRTGDVPVRVELVGVRGAPPACRAGTLRAGWRAVRG